VIRTVLQVGFWLGLAAWTVLLVRPTTTFRPVSDELASWGDVLPFLVSKALHLTAYAGLAVAALVLFRRWRWRVLGAVAAHAVAGEVGQYVGNGWYATGREGSVKDVLIDWAGMAVGCGVWWAWRRLVGKRAGSAG
jgi:VanZ family protein